MSGIYIHIPFCKQACHYCNFHFSTSLRKKEELLQALIREIGMTTDYLPTHELQSIYFGGGTPSLLTEKELNSILEELSRHYHWGKDAEITLEANPDDITPEKVHAFHQAGITRWSIGIQSFQKADLVYMNRAHTVEEADRSIRAVQNAGFDKVTIDLIYGTPTMNDRQWKENIKKAIDYGIPHISAYALTVEENTALDHFIRKGKSVEVQPGQARRQLDILIGQLETAGYHHYEISNFAKSGQYAIHNTAYWQGAAYLGLGPAAHSFKEKERRWNIANNVKYIHSIAEGSVPYEAEQLSGAERQNEILMTSLRTMWGLHPKDIMMEYQEDIIAGLAQKEKQGYVYIEDGCYKLTREGKHYADFVAMELFVG